MASIGRDPGGGWRLLFVDPNDGRRHTLHLGQIRRGQVNDIKGMVERIIKSRGVGSPDPAAAAWLAGLPAASYGKLVRLGLVESRAVPAPVTKPGERVKQPLGKFLDEYLADRTDLKPHSLVVYGHTRRNLIDFFGSDKAIEDITSYDAEQWQRYLGRHEAIKRKENLETLAKATIRKRTTNAKAFFAVAVKKKIIPANPFEGLVSKSVSNKARQRFISHADIQKVLEACPDSQWGAIVALCRYGGLRCPTEPLALTWGDVNWEQGRILVHSPKTARFEGHESRLLPLFPELRPYLEAVFQEHLEMRFPKAADETAYVITRYRQANVNLRTQLHRIIRRAGLVPWPRTFQNLRSSRETERADSYPVHVVTAWLGNTPKVAEDHYLQMREDYFARAASTPTNPAHIPVQPQVESTRHNSQEASEPVYANTRFPEKTKVCDASQVSTDCKVEPMRFELTTSCMPCKRSPN